MRPVSIVGFILGLFLVALGILTILSGSLSGIIPLGIGVTLGYLGYKGGYGPLVIFGHGCVVAGCFLTTWGIYLLPYSKPTISHVVTRPLFWGLFSIFGGLCALFHGFCRCVRGFTADQEK